MIFSSLINTDDAFLSWADMEASVGVCVCVYKSVLAWSLPYLS